MPQEYLAIQFEEMLLKTLLLKSWQKKLQVTTKSLRYDFFEENRWLFDLQLQLQGALLYHTASEEIQKVHLISGL